jgi:hypothetical protein
MFKQEKERYGDGWLSGLFNDGLSSYRDSNSRMIVNNVEGNGAGLF